MLFKLTMTMKMPNNEKDLYYLTMTITNYNEKVAKNDNYN